MLSQLLEYLVNGEKKINILYVFFVPFLRSLGLTPSDGVRGWMERRGPWQQACWRHLLLDKATLTCKSCWWAFLNYFFLPPTLFHPVASGMLDISFTLTMSPSLRAFLSLLGCAWIRCKMLPQADGSVLFQGFYCQPLLGVGQIE